MLPKQTQTAKTQSTHEAEKNILRLRVGIYICTELYLPGSSIIHSTSKESSTNNNMEADLVAKVVSMCILGGISLLLGLLPIKLNEKYNLREEKNGSRVTTIKQLVITALNCFGAGVILTTCFGHMLPEANEAIKGSGIKDKG